MILIYTHHITSRITYASDLVFKFVLGIEYKLTDDADYFKTYQQVKIAYTNHLNLSEITIFSDDLMFENNIKSFHVKAEKIILIFQSFSSLISMTFWGMIFLQWCFILQADMKNICQLIWMNISVLKLRIVWLIFIIVCIFRF